MAVLVWNSHAGMSVKTAGTTNASIKLDSTVNPGRTLIACILFDNFTTASKPVVSSIAKEAGETNNWVFIGAARSTSTSGGAFASGEMWAIQTTVSWSSLTYTVTLDSSVTMKATRTIEAVRLLPTLRNTVGTAYSTTTTAASATTTGTTPVVGDLAVGFLFGSNVAAAQAGDTDTTAGTWNGLTGLGSTGGSGATNNYGLIQYKELTAATHQTFNNSAAMTAGNGSIVAIFQAEPDPTITQAAYRFYADGTESGSTALAAQDATPTVDVTSGDMNAQLRVRLQSTNATTLWGADDFQLQWERNVSGTWTNVGSPALVESNPLANFTSTSEGLASDSFLRVGQSFLGMGKSLVRAGFRLMAATGIPNGTISAALYAHTGTFGSTGLPTGSPLATSTTTVAPSSVWGNAGMYYFDFDGTYALENGSPYFIVAVSDTTTPFASGYIGVGNDNTPSHAGNAAVTLSGTWTTRANDTIFEVYGPAATVTPYNSPNLTDNAATTSRLTGGTGTFTAGKVSEDGLVDDLGWAGNNYTELLYSLTFKAADLTNGDTIRFRVLRNGVTTGLTYTQTPTVNITGSFVAPVARPRNIRMSSNAVQRSYTR